jgi:hypothetical protein
MARPAANAPEAPQIPALQKWPAAPRHFTPEEKAEFKKLGRTLLLIGVTAADVPMAEDLAQLRARLTKLQAAGAAKETALNALRNIILKMQQELGLGRKSRATMPATAPAKSAEPNEFAELDEE